MCLGKRLRKMQSYPAISRDNNFDLECLFAALQVAFFHVQNRMEQKIFS